MKPKILLLIITLVAGVATGVIGVIFLFSGQSPIPEVETGNPFPSATPIPKVETDITLPSQESPYLHFQVEEEARKALKPGQIAFNHPTEMKLGETEKVIARISGDLQRDITEGLGANLETAKLEVSTFMKATLTGSDFTIEPSAEQKQMLLKGRIAEWRWDVTPKKSGKKTLELTVYARVKFANQQQEEDIYLKTLSSTITVDVNIRGQIEEILSNNWQWALENWDKLLGLSAFIRATGTAFWARLKHKKPSSQQ
jgi:hypothetical protein